MSTEKYVIVQDPMGVTGNNQPPGQVDARALESAARKFDGALVEVADLTPREAMAVANSPNMVAAQIMPTSLIAPMVSLDDSSWHNLQGKPAEVTADASAAGNWGIEAIGANASTYDGAGTKIAVLDTGIDANHIAFAGVNILQQDFTGEGNGDGNGHGTHCAGTILGRDVDGRRIGVARGASDLLNGKVLDSNGSGSSEALFKAMNWAVFEHVDVISMSLGFDFPGMIVGLINQGLPKDLAASRGLVAYRQNLRAFDAIMATIKAMASFNSGSLVVAASGNESRTDINPKYRIDASLPAAAFDVLAIAAADRVGAGGLHPIAPFSNGAVQITAPGVRILSAQAGTTKGLVALSGTSMACPHVAGLAALWWQHLRQASPNGLSSARMVAAQLSAKARMDVFMPGLGTFDFGDGLGIAP